MENSQNYSDLVQAAFGDYQQEANVKQLAEQKTQEEKEEIQGLTSPFEAEGLREGIGGLISTAKDKIIDKVKGKAKELLDKAKKEASDKFDELKSKSDEFKSQASDKFDELQSQADEFKSQAQGKLDDLQGKIDKLQEKGKPKTPKEEAPEEAPEEADVEADAEVPAEVDAEVIDPSYPPASATLPEFSGDPALSTLKQEQETPPETEAPGEAPQVGEAPQAGQSPPDASDAYSAQEEAGDQTSTAPIEGDEDLQLQSFTNDGADVADVVEETAQVSTDVADVAEASTILDVDPVTAAIGLAVGIGSMIVGNLFESHTEAPPQVKFNVSQQLGVY